MTVDCYTTGRNDVCATADNFCYAEVEYLYDLYLERDEYDVRYLTPDPFPYNYYVDYLNRPKVQQAIGAFVNYTDSNSAVGNAFGNTGDDDRTQGAVQDCRDLIDQGIYLVQFNGDADYICNWIGNEAVVDKIDAPGYASAGYTNISTSDDIVHGQVKQSANFAFARIYEAGHEVPFYQPVVALEMFDRAINGLDIATGEERVEKGCGYQTQGTKRSTYMEGNATVQFEVTPANATYNTMTDEPGPPMGGKRVKRSSEVRKSIDRRGRLTRPVERRMGAMGWPRT